MLFESLFKSGVEKSEEELAMERIVEEVQRKILAKTENPEVARFFRKKDEQNLEVLESHPQSDLNRIFRLSRDLMNQVIKDPWVIDGTVEFFHPKIG